MIEILSAGTTFSGSSKGVGSGLENSGKPQGFAHAIEMAEKASDDGKDLPEDDAHLPVEALDDLLVQGSDSELEPEPELDETRLLDEPELEPLPDRSFEARPELVAPIDRSANVDSGVVREEQSKLASTGSVKGVAAAGTDKPALTLALADTGERSSPDSRDSDMNDKRMNPVESKSIGQQRPEVSVPVKVTDAGWQEAIAQRVTMLINQRNSMARIHINPPELGPVEVRLNVNHDQASVQFLSHSSLVRDVLEQSIPRLRDMLESAGIELADSHVGEQNHPDSESGNNKTSAGEHLSESEIADDDELRITTSISEGLLDAYA